MTMTVTMMMTMTMTVAMTVTMTMIMVIKMMVTMLTNTMMTHDVAASSAPPLRWAARCVVYLYSADSPVALSRSDDEVGVT